MILEYRYGAIPITQEQAEQLFTPTEMAAGEQRGRLKTFGPWGIPVSYTALCTSCTYDKYPIAHGPLHIYGVRTMGSIHQSGYELEGRVSVNGKKYRAFTSSQLFELPNGNLVNAAIIHACGAAERA